MINFLKILKKDKEKVSLKENKKLFIEDFKDILMNADETTINNFIKFMANSVQGELISKCFYNDRNYVNYFDYIIRSFLLDLPYDNFKKCNIEIDIPITPIITCIWNHDRLKNNLKNIGECTGNPFNGKKHQSNIMGIYIKPINLVIINNGNHSVNSAIVHNEGTLIINTEIDISPLFKKYEFDGEDYIDLNNNKKIYNNLLIDNSKPFTYTIGLLFEMARVIDSLKNN